ncbi:hypothetical protein ACKKBF_B33280 [Auxenochlorella protothecoides x Auxenochlorella symbiontica]
MVKGTENTEATRTVTQLYKDASLFNKYANYMKYEKRGLHCSILYREPADLPKSWSKWMLDLTRTNMKAHYEACPGWGWREREKKSELAHPSARYLVAASSVAESEENIAACNSEQGCDVKPVAFLHFRFEVEDHKPILYLYELQLDNSVQRKGLGQFLVRLLELVAWQSGLSQLKLTVLNTNDGAGLFYKSMGFALDQTSPSAVSLDAAPGYEILSKKNPRL